ncbi:hypothetical protein TPHA_0A02640 [Tetrapisispora phaffii CBS 4417]|uniref:MHD domain-containing protein n=1 Tax=Tetrapisispora phaffii (strain ATCC 24235 / CBS 4417 / NBRC 1672 / NRRL Y-8282 / UCD 70-5) TaxID=1071381 RepID=G8BN68_TETPH|nr:hypothetical protein TPHA_0A02640 [Tetrapisispora phaffii CBS 4417]CCE61346.1 hypothetical protein TPHA_0A02640 [Tetrapisispora phaffii CBS 4417]
MTSDRLRYVDSILSNKAPNEALEILRLRTSEAKLIDKEFYNVMNDYQKIRENYNSQLSQLLKKYENKADLKMVINEKLVSENVLSASELNEYEYFPNVSTDLMNLWKLFLNELKNEYKSNERLNHLINEESLRPLRVFSERDSNWNKSRKLYSSLSAMKENNNNEFSDNWNSKGPYIYELFETIDFDHLANIKSSIIRYQTNYNDYLVNATKHSEKPLSSYSDYDPSKEIDRFASEASNFDFKFISSNNSPSKPMKKRSTFGNLTSRLHSSSTLNYNELMNNEFSDSTNNMSLKNNKKGDSRLKSTMGSIFGRNKNKTTNQNSLNNEKDVRIDTVEEDFNINQAVRSSSRRATTNSIKPEYFKRGSFSSDNIDSAEDLNNRSSSRPHSRMNSTTTDFRKSASKRNSIYNSLKETDDNASPFADQPPVQDENNSQLHSDSSSNSNKISHLSMYQPPLKPLPRTVKTEPILPSFGNMAINSNIVPQQQQQLTNGKSLFSNVSNFNMPHVQSTMTSPFQQPPQAAGVHQPVPDLFSQVTGELQTLDPQTTGPLASMQQGQSVFQHSSDKTVYGLSASIAEVINAKFREGILVESEVIGEIAFSYVPNYHANSIPDYINLRIKNSSNFDKTILNQGYIEKINNEDYKLYPNFIESKTLGGLKYTIKPAEAPIIILPVWNFEIHQASVVLTLKLSPDLSPSVQKLVLEDVTIFVTVDGAETVSALSKPQGTFNKEKKRITWRFTEPLVLHRNSEERLIARFMTNGLGIESTKGISAKFTIRENTHQNIAVGSALIIESKEHDEKNPFGSPWKSIDTTRTLTAGNYIGLSI